MAKHTKNCCTLFLSHKWEGPTVNNVIYKFFSCKNDPDTIFYCTDDFKNKIPVNYAQTRKVYAKGDKSNWGVILDAYENFIKTNETLAIVPSGPHPLKVENGIMSYCCKFIGVDSYDLNNGFKSFVYVFECGENVYYRSTDNLNFKYVSKSHLENSAIFPWSIEDSIAKIKIIHNLWAKYKGTPIVNEKIPPVFPPHWNVSQNCCQYLGTFKYKGEPYETGTWHVFRCGPKVLCQRKEDSAGAGFWFSDPIKNFKNFIGGVGEEIYKRYLKNLSTSIDAILQSEAQTMPAPNAISDDLIKKISVQMAKDLKSFLDCEGRQDLEFEITPSISDCSYASSGQVSDKLKLVFHFGAKVKPRPKKDVIQNDFSIKKLSKRILKGIKK